MTKAEVIATIGFIKILPRFTDTDYCDDTQNIYYRRITDRQFKDYEELVNRLITESDE